MRDGFVYRYAHDEDAQSVDGLPPGEGAFLPCTFWLADNLALQGRLDEAEEIFERLLALRNEVGLLAEEWDPAARRQLGNFPQAFTHVPSSTRPSTSTGRNTDRRWSSDRPRRNRRRTESCIRRDELLPSRSCQFPSPRRKQFEAFSDGPRGPRAGCVWLRVDGSGQPFLGRIPLGSHVEPVYGQTREQPRRHVAELPRDYVVRLVAIHCARHDDRDGEVGSQALQSDPGAGRDLQQHLRKHRLARRCPDLARERHVAHHAGDSEGERHVLQHNYVQHSGVAQPGDVPGGRAHIRPRPPGRELQQRQPRNVHGLHE